MSPTRCFCFGRCCPLLGHPPPTQGPTEPPQDTHIPPNGTHSGTRVWHPESSVAPTVAPCVDLPPNLTLLVTPHTTHCWSHHTTPLLVTTRHISYGANTGAHITSHTRTRARIRRTFKSYTGPKSNIISPTYRNCLPNSYRSYR